MYTTTKKKKILLIFFHIFTMLKLKQTVFEIFACFMELTNKWKAIVRVYLFIRNDVKWFWYDDVEENENKILRLWDEISLMYVWQILDDWIDVIRDAVIVSVLLMKWVYLFPSRLWNVRKDKAVVASTKQTLNCVAD